MTSDWPLVELGDVTVNHDSRRVPVRKRDRRPGPYPYYGASGIVDYVDDSIFEGCHLLIAEDGENLRSRRLPIAFLADGRYWVNNHAHVVTANDRADTRFLCYALAATDIAGYVTGSAIPKLNQRAMKAIEIRLPPVRVQRAIASLLGSLDNKIEQNRSTARALEVLASAIFRAWFVDFAPVKAKAAGATSFPSMPQEAFAALPSHFVASDIGPVPEEWEVKALAECVHLTMGQSPPSETYNVSGDGLPFHQGVTDYGFRLPSHRIYCTVNSRLAEPRDVLLSVRAPVGRINVADRRLVLGRGLAGLRHRSNRQSFLLHQLNHVFAEEDSVGDGTIYKAVTKQFLAQMPMLSPSENAQIAFESITRTLDDHVAACEAESRKLAEMRDLLLPKLLSGQIRLEAANN